MKLSLFWAPHYKYVHICSYMFMYVHVCSHAPSASDHLIPATPKLRVQVDCWRRHWRASGSCCTPPASQKYCSESATSPGECLRWQGWLTVFRVFPQVAKRCMGIFHMSRIRSSHIPKNITKKKGLLTPTVENESATVDFAKVFGSHNLPPSIGPSNGASKGNLFCACRHGKSPFLMGKSWKIHYKWSFIICYIYMGVDLKMLAKPLNPMVLLIIIPMKNG